MHIVNAGKYLYLFLYVVLFSGRGGKEGAVEKCTNCRGSGMQVRIQQLAPGMMQQIQSMCHECQGQGERINPKLRCKVCSGKKTVRERKILEVHIDKGKGNFMFVTCDLVKKKKKVFLQRSYLYQSPSVSFPLLPSLCVLVF